MTTKYIKTKQVIHNHSIDCFELVITILYRISVYMHKFIMSTIVYYDYLSSVISDISESKSSAVTVVRAE